jgi:hypothetical protein
MALRAGSSSAAGHGRVGLLCDDSGRRGGLRYWRRHCLYQVDPGREPGCRAAAVEATETTRKIGQRQVRAYLQLTGVDFEHVEYVEDGVAPTINLHFKNFGQSPGRKVVNHMTVTFVFAGKPKFKEPIAIDAAGMDIGPGQDTTTTTFVSLDGLREALENRVAKMFVGGVITYVDVFDEPHTTRYRLQLHVNPEGLRDTDAFIICKDGNDVRHRTAAHAARARTARPSTPEPPYLGCHAAPSCRGEPSISWCV